LNGEDDILVVSEHGYGKRSKIEDYRVTNRGGKGVKTINVTEKTGALVSIKNVTDTDDLMIITEAGVTIRLSVDTIRMTGRAAQGVRLINLREDDRIASVARVENTVIEDDSDLISSIAEENEMISDSDDIETNNNIE